MKVLITGITGFAGSHLAEYIIANHPGTELYGTIRWRSRMENLMPEVLAKVTLRECELRDAVAVRNVLADIKPDRIFHLAAQSFVPTSWVSPNDTLQTNIASTVNIFESLRELQIDPWVQVACSSEEYGMVYQDELPIREANPLRPLSPYAVSKVAQDMLCYQYHASYGAKAVRTRGFNHTGPRRGEVFVCSNFARQIVLIEKGMAEPVIKVGNLAARRDFTDVRDMVRGYWLSLDGGCQPGEVYNLGSGTDYVIQDILDKLLAAATAKVTVKQDPLRMRPSDVPVLLADNSKFCRATGWAPTIGIEQTLNDILAYWRGRL